MGWRGVMRSAMAAQRAAAREAGRRQRAQIRAYNAYQKQASIDQARTEAAIHEQFIASITSLHRVPTTNIDWTEIRDLDIPSEPVRQTQQENRAEKELSNYYPGLFERLTGKAKQKREALNSAVVSGYEIDTSSHMKALEAHNTKLKEIADARAIAQGVLAKNPAFYVRAVEESEVFEGLSELGSYIQILVDENQPEAIRVRLYLHNQDMIPGETKTVLASGKLSVKKMPPTRFNELFQDYVCSSVLRTGQEIFSALPVDFVLIDGFMSMLNPATGKKDWQPIVSALLPRSTMDSIDMSSADPSDCLKNFLGRSKFTKSGGFSPITILSPDELPFTFVEPAEGSLIELVDQPEAEERSPGIVHDLSITPSQRSSGGCAGYAVASLATVAYWFICAGAPQLGMILTGLAAVAYGLWITDRALRKKSVALPVLMMVASVVIGGYISYAILHQRQILQEAQAQRLAQQLEQTKELERNIETARTDVDQARFADAISILIQVSNQKTIPAESQKAGQLLEQVGQIVTREKLAAAIQDLSDQEFANFKKTQTLPRDDYFSDPLLESGFRKTALDLTPEEIQTMRKAH